MRHSKIHATLGPATFDPQILRRMVEAGMDACRINMSHSSHEQTRTLVRLVRAISAEIDRPISIGADLKGPKLRIGEILGGSVILLEGEPYDLAEGDGPGDGTVARVDYPYLLSDLRSGDPVLLSDGTLVLRVEEIRQDCVRCRIEKGGILSSRKGVNFPGVRLETPSLTEKDQQDMIAAVRAGVDFIYLSYARSAKHVEAARDALRRIGARLPLVAKVERLEGVEALEEITWASDGVCVARGDLGIEVPLGSVPAIQSRAAKMCREHGRLGLMGGQVLSTMTTNPLPLRAEVADVATAVRDGVDGLILSDETAVGAYPIEVVQICGEILQRAEDSWQSGSASRAAAVISPDGKAAQSLSATRRFAPLVAIVDEPAVANWLAGWWGVIPVLRGRNQDPAYVATRALGAAGHPAGQEDLLIFSEDEALAAASSGG